jgi:NitT/TauT family transport system substrate-binding protein
MLGTAAAVALVGGGRLAGKWLGVGRAQAETLSSVRMGVLHSGLFTVIHAVALQGGYYARHGIDPQVTDVRSGDGTAGVESLLRNSLDVYLGTPVELTRVNSRAIAGDEKPPLAIVAAGAPNFTNLVLRKGLTYAGIANLKGLRIGVSSPGSDHLVKFRFLLAEKGLTTDGLGIRILPLGSSNMLPALTSGQIDGFLHSEPTVSIALIKAGATLAISGKQFGTSGDSPGLSLNVGRDWAAAHRDVLTRLVKALWDASDDYTRMPEAKAVEIFQSYMPSDPEILSRAYGNLDPRLHDLTKMADVFWKVNVAAMRERGEVVAELKPQDLFDYSFSPGTISG